MIDNDIHQRIMQLEDSDRKLSQEVGSLHSRLDTALLTLTHNVNSLTEAINALRESQSQTTALQHSMILLQERASIVPELQKQVNTLIVADAGNTVILKGIRFLAGTVAATVVGIVVAAIWSLAGTPPA